MIRQIPQALGAAMALWNPMRFHSKGAAATVPNLFPTFKGEVRIQEEKRLP